MQVMLAGKVDLTRLKYPVLASYKLDGIRAYVSGGVLLSRRNKPIPNNHLQKMFGKKKYDGLDGELIIGTPNSPTAFRTTDSIVMSKNVLPTLQCVFHVFDNFLTGGGFQNRLLSARRTATHAQMRVVDQFLMTNADDLNTLEEKAIAAGYEGLMLRALDGPYKQGRSTTREGYLLKLKQFEDSEATVLGAEELEHNLNDKNAAGERSTHKAGMVKGGVMGALLVRDVHTGVEFSIGSGFTAAERKELWALRETLPGRTARYKFFATGGKDKPRFPIFSGWRNVIDIHIKQVRRRK